MLCSWKADEVYPPEIDYGDYDDDDEPGSEL
jgi:hypothetical protein